MLQIDSSIGHVASRPSYAEQRPHAVCHVSPLLGCQLSVKKVSLNPIIGDSLLGVINSRRLLFPCLRELARALLSLTLVFTIQTWPWGQPVTTTSSISLLRGSTSCETALSSVPPLSLSRLSCYSASTCGDFSRAGQPGALPLARLSPRQYSPVTTFLMCDPDWCANHLPEG